MQSTSLIEERTIDIIELLGSDVDRIKTFVENLVGDTEVKVTTGDWRQMSVPAWTVVVGKQHLFGARWQLVKGRMFLRELLSGKCGIVESGGGGYSAPGEMKVAVFTEGSEFREFTTVGNWGVRPLEDTRWEQFSTEVVKVGRRLVK
jgi:hypothetical protein